MSEHALEEILRRLDEMSRHLAARRAGPPPAEQLVTLDQCAATVGLRKRSLERYRGQMPPPRVKGRNGRPTLWAWLEVRPWLEKTFGRDLEGFFRGP